MSDICLNCNENIAIDPWYCFSCGIEIYYSETIFETEEAL